MSTPTKKQKIKKVRVIGKEKLIVEIRHDDECENGHNSFTITAKLSEQLANGQDRFFAGGRLHEEVVRFFPELEKYIKWHLCSTDGPMHYIANTMYFASSTAPDLKAARDCAIWPDATLEQLQDKEALEARRPALLEKFRAAVESLGLTY